MSRWLVVGANGMLGHDLVSVGSAAGIEVVGLDLPDIDITSPESVARALREVGPNVVLNAAAYTAVDAAEDNEALALRINGDGPGNLARAVAEVPDTWLVHISTDYVFAGDAQGSYSEYDEPGPRSAYGRTKLAGEVQVRQALPDRHYLVRTAWLYGEHGPNFARTMLNLEASRPTVDVVDDQRGQPTWSRDLADQVLSLLSAQGPAGIYHGTSSGQTTWYGFAREVFRLAGADPDRVRPTTTDKFPRPAPRPANSVLGHERWSAAGLEPIRDWQEALAQALPLLVSQKP